MKHPTEPSKYESAVAFSRRDWWPSFCGGFRFVESEVDLDEEIKRLHVLATAPELYPELIRHNSLVSLLQLIAHENSDISVSVLALFRELTEIDTLAETEGALALVSGMVWSLPPRFCVLSLRALCNLVGAGGTLSV
jgi:Catenin-beta-like, Arm-motif containing nuclear